MAKLKIGFVVDDTLDKPDGVQQYVLLLGSWLRGQGHEVHYLVGESGRRDVPHVHSLSRNIKVKFNKNKLSIPLPANKKAIKDLLEAQQFDVLHVQMPYSPLLAGRIITAAPEHTAIVGTFHILPFSNLEKKATRLLGRMLRRTLQRFDTILAVSEPAAQFTAHAFGVTPQVLPNVVDLAHFQRSLHAYQRADHHGKTTIVFLGRLVHRKGALELLKAVAALPADIRAQVDVRIGGKGALLPKLEQYVKETGMVNQVHFDGFVAEEDKPNFLHEADIAVFPSLGGESFGIVLLEGMAAGSGVVLGGNNPGYASVLAPFPGTLFDPKDTSAFAKLLQQYITDIPLQAQIHFEQQAAITQYDVATVGPKLVQIYEAAVAKRPTKQDNTNT